MLVRAAKSNPCHTPIVIPDARLQAQLGFGELDLALATFQRVLALPCPDDPDPAEMTRHAELADDVAADIGFVTELIAKRAEHAASVGKSEAVYTRAVGVTAAATAASVARPLSTRPWEPS